jgi:uncharacterized protein DUF3303
MQFMVIEKFDPQDAVAIYRRFQEQGRGIPDGLTYVDSWVDAGLDRVWQIMETDDPALIQEWIAFWADLVDFEVVPVTKSSATLEALRSRLGGQPTG